MRNNFKELGEWDKLVAWAETIPRELMARVKTLNPTPILAEWPQMKIEEQEFHAFAKN